MSKIQKMVARAIEIANDNSHGYDQIDRDGNPNFDCTGLAYHCANYAGYDVPTTGLHYTGTIRDHFGRIGWRVDAFDGNLNDLETGDLLLRDTHPDGHVAIYVGFGQLVEASSNELGGITGGKSGDQTGREIYQHAVYNGRWTHVLTPPKEDNTPTAVAKQQNNNEKIIELAKQIIELAKG